MRQIKKDQVSHLFKAPPTSYICGAERYTRFYYRNHKNLWVFDTPQHLAGRSIHDKASEGIVVPVPHETE